MLPLLFEQLPDWSLDDRSRSSLPRSQIAPRFDQPRECGLSERSRDDADETQHSACNEFGSRAQVSVGRWVDTHRACVSSLSPADCLLFASPIFLPDRHLLQLVSLLCSFDTLRTSFLSRFNMAFGSYREFASRWQPETRFSSALSSRFVQATRIPRRSTIYKLRHRRHLLLTETPPARAASTP